MAAPQAMPASSRPSSFLAALLLALALSCASLRPAAAKDVVIPPGINILNELYPRLFDGNVTHHPDQPALEGLLVELTHAANAFLWAYPLVNTAPSVIFNGIHAQSDMYQWMWQPVPNNFSYNSIVTPNVNVLYGSLFLDLSKGAVHLTVPETYGRYYVLQIMDFWGLTFARIGFTTTGTAPGNYTLVGPSYKGKLAANMFQSTTEGVWVFGRVGVINQNATDIAISDALLPKFHIAVEKTSSTIYKSTTKAAKLFDTFLTTNRTKSFWQAYNAMIPYNLPLPNIIDAGKPFADLGITLSGVNYYSLSTYKKQLLDYGAIYGYLALQRYANTPSYTNSSAILLTSTHWGTVPSIGQANNSIATAALVSYAYIAANIPAEAVYWSRSIDPCGQRYSIGKNYVFQMPSRPPVLNGSFWSMTLYNTTDFFLIDTTNNTYTLGNQFPNLKLNSQGGATLYFSQKPPKDTSKWGNWLPLGTASMSPKELFYMIFRVYGPTNGDIIYTYAPANVELADDDFVPLGCNSTLG